MTHPRTNATPPGPTHDADRLGDAWDALVAGRRPTEAEEDAEMMAVAGQLSSEAAHGASQTRPTLTFRNSLRETLMHSGPMPMNAASPAPTFHPLPKLSRPVEIGHPTRPSAALPERIRATGMRWAALAATIALLLATAAGGYLATRGPGEGNPTRVAGFAASPVASPETAEWVDPCPGRPYSPCGSPAVIARAIFDGEFFSPRVLDASLVTMQGWEVAAGEVVTWLADPNPLVGVATDMVLEGTYVATFSGPAVVSRPDPMGSGTTYPAAGEVVELGRGDTVSFELGTRVELSNPLSTQPLRFKSVVVHLERQVDTGAPGSGQPIEGNPSGGDVHISEDGVGTLPKSLDTYPNRELALVLMYIQVQPGFPLPTPTDRDGIIVGPVDPIQEDIEEGYIVWANEVRG